MADCPFYTFDELHAVLFETHRCSREELIFWIYNRENCRTDHFFQIPDENFRIEPLTAFIYDIPQYKNYYKSTGIINLNPEYFYYLKDVIKQFKIDNLLRFVYVHELAGKRNWPRHARSETNLYSDYPALDEAAKKHILRFYDNDLHEFTYKKKFKVGDNESEQYWIDTSEGQDSLSQPDTFFLLQDIINIERLFFNRTRQDCLKELGIDDDQKTES